AGLIVVGGGGIRIVSAAATIGSVRNTDLRRKPVSGLVGSQDARVGRRLHVIAVGLAEVGVVGRSGAFITNNRIEDTHFPVDSIAYRRAQGDVSLADVVGQPHAVGDGPNEELNVVTGSPRALIQRLVDGNINHVQVDAVRITTVVIVRRATTAAVGVELSRHINVAADGRIRQRGLHLADLAFVRTCRRGQTDHADRCETQCPFIKLHLVPPMLFGYLFVLPAFSGQYRIVPAPTECD